MLRAILPPSNQKGDAALMFGLDAAAPSGPPSAERMHLMHSAAGSRWFRWKVIMWSWVRRLGSFDWDAFQVSLKEAEFREYRDNWEAKRSIGWAGQNPREFKSAMALRGMCPGPPGVAHRTKYRRPRAVSCSSRSPERRSIIPP